MTTSGKHTHVVNLRDESVYDVYIGRPSKWGNMFTHVPTSQKTLAVHRVATRKEAIESYERWLLANPVLLADLHELQGKVLGCFCAPLPCHGDVLARLANALPEKL